MFKKIITTFFLPYSIICSAQPSPSITSWLQNTTQMGTYYMSGNSTALSNNILANCQKVEYSTNFVYVTATGVPSYPTGPFNDFNPSNAQNQNAIFQFPLSPSPNSGTLIPTNGGNIGVFINGVAVFDYRDGVAWNPNTNSLCGGPGKPPCPGGPMASMDWNRDAIPAEMAGFDCSKGHPAMGNYHHHQNPSAFKIDLSILSNICNLYDADGLYTPDSNSHSPLIGFAYDGYPIYGAYGFKNSDGTGGIERIKSGYQLRTITSRLNGPAVGTVVTAGGPGGATQETLFLGYFREDYEHITHASQDDYLDQHNGRFAVTPEYPNGTYAYYATVDGNWNSSYPYLIGPTFYGNASNRKVSSISQSTTIYSSSVGEYEIKDIDISIYPNPSSELIAIQYNGLVEYDIEIELIDEVGRTVKSKRIGKGSTIAYFDLKSIYQGFYTVRLTTNSNQIIKKIQIVK
ncbi:MAG: Uncharacterised protein [Owenweeksia sp. TMED14]|nr:MAG: Uncharacterised protein [Owenweeksia sp. TMED14]